MNDLHTPNPSQSVASIVLDHSECAVVFQRHRIDFCCRGGDSVEAAAQRRGLNLDELMNELRAAVQERGSPTEVGPRALATPLLVEHIVSRHHDYLRSALPFLRPLAAKVARVHGDHNPRLLALDEAVAELTATLLPHLDQEERELFPALLSPESDPSLRARLLESMTAEHHAVAELLERIREATLDFSLPDWACNSYRTLFAELETLERDVFTHVHLENHVLAPRFSAESATGTDATSARFRLEEEAETLRQNSALREAGFASKTLVRRADARVVLIVLEPGARLHEHKTEHSVLVQTLRGRVQLHLPRETIELKGGELLALDAGVPHDLAALEASQVLLTIGWPAPAALP